MSSLRLILRSLAFHWRIQLAVALGVVAGTAVLTGALLVGDSVRGSLQQLTLERLGNIDEALVVDRFFRADLAEEFAARPGFSEHAKAALPVVLLRGTLEHTDNSARANAVTVLGTDDRLAEAGPGGPTSPPGPDEIVLNEPLASELNASVGDEVILRVGQTDDVPADSPWGRTMETVRNLRLTVREIIPAKGLGRFGLRPSQQLPLNAFVATETLQRTLDEPDGVNALFIVGAKTDEVPTADADKQLQALLDPTLEDYGLVLRRTDRGYYQITSDRMLLSEALQQQLLQKLGEYDARSAMTYLANTIADGDREIPYSTITAMDFATEPPLGPLLDANGQQVPTPGDNEIVLNAWAAERLEAKVGDTIRIDYFQPESTHGEPTETSTELTLSGIVALDGVAIDPALTPEVKGVTDQDSIADWDPPFPFEQGRIEQEDEDYWDSYRGTPKAFVSLATGQRLWGSRFGDATSIQIPPPENEVESPDEVLVQLRNQITLDPPSQGFTLLPVKRQGLMAASGTTPFDVLFLSFSFFIIAAAVMLVALLFRLGIEQRAREVGIELAVGLSPARVRRIMVAEGLLVSLIAGLIGIVVGVAYAWLMIAGLRTWWVAAVSTPFLQLHVTPKSLIIGYFSGVLVSVLAIAWTMWRLRRVSASRLLAGASGEAEGLRQSTGRWSRRIAIGSAVGAVAVGLLASSLGGEAQIGAFFGSGALALVALLAGVRWYFTSRPSGSLVTTGSSAVLRLAIRNAARNPARSTLTIALVASTCFLIVAISAFRIDPTQELPSRNSGNGGFALVAESDQPIYQDLGSADGRFELGVPDNVALDTSEVISFRVRSGDDASCLNLYQPRQPRVLGVSPQMIERGGFKFAATAAETPEEEENPWLLLNQTLPPDDQGQPVVPVMIDMNTAMYSLHLWNGVGETYSIDDGHGGEITFQVVGLYSNSLFQGDLLISESQFRKLFPDVSGRQFFLIACEPSDTNEVEQVLEAALGDYGFDSQNTAARLAGFLAVQNTYLSTFQSLGGLGLLLGTFGLATVQLRNVFERRGELALMRAAGFRRQRLAIIVLLENAVLLVGGLLVGCVAAVVAVLPHLFGGGASIPWASLAATLGLVLVVGMLAGLFAVRATLRTPLLPALRAQ